MHDTGPGRGRSGTRVCPSAGGTPMSKRNRALGALLAAALTGAAALALVTAPSAGAAAGCPVASKVNEWQAVFVGYVDLTAGATALHGWQVNWSYPAGQHLT